MEEYLASFPEEVRPVLEEVRRAIRAAAPDAEETVAYNMPTYKVDGRSLVHFAGWTTYVSVYPLPEPGTAADPGLEDDLAAYRATRGTAASRWTDRSPTSWSRGRCGPCGSSVSGRSWMFRCRFTTGPGMMRLR
ncbi:hypothetical protein GCM10009844_12350 [Nocardioides koreensis]|uniref:YdhG-like domain-containing protein n=1 Tax=Nocardioides koreensis TaxID=433651 RepID=A0ABP5L841_9ACTN